jgi:hypothetical protein
VASASPARRREAEAARTVVSRATAGSSPTLQVAAVFAGFRIRWRGAEQHSSGFPADGWLPRSGLSKPVNQERLNALRSASASHDVQVPDPGRGVGASRHGLHRDEFGVARLIHHELHGHNAPPHARFALYPAADCYR